MKVLVVGSGGREHALAWALRRSPLISELLCAPGNPGMGAIAERHSVSIDDLDGIVELATYEEVDLAVIGPETPIVAGIGDMLRAKGIKVFGPGRAGALLEGSKIYAKEMMNRTGIPTASAKEFTESQAAIAYALDLGGRVAVKVDGLAAGKGVAVCEGMDEARRAITAALDERIFGESGSRVLIEERLEGQEISVLAFSDGKRVLPMEAAQDYKRIFDGDRGPNTGGMGAYSPVTFATEEVIEEVTRKILEPISAAVAEDAEPYVGVIYAGLMLTRHGPRVIEFNCRFGDPEIQALLPRLETDLAEVILACVEGSLDSVKLSWKPDACACVVAASQGYPGEYHTGFPIEGIGDAEDITGLPVFHAGTKLGPDGSLVTAGGRVLNVCGLGSDLGEARSRAYEGMAAIRFPGMIYRSDVAA